MPRSDDQAGWPGLRDFRARMEILLLIPIVAFAAIYTVYREWLNAAHRRWLGEIDLYQKRLSAYEEFKRAVAMRSHRDRASI